MRDNDRLKLQRRARWVRFFLRLGRTQRRARPRRCSAAARVLAAAVAAVGLVVVAAIRQPIVMHHLSSQATNRPEGRNRLRHWSSTKSDTTPQKGTAPPLLVLGSRQCIVGFDRPRRFSQNTHTSSPSALNRSTTRSGTGIVDHLVGDVDCNTPATAQQASDMRDRRAVQKRLIGETRAPNVADSMTSAGGGDLRTKLAA
jgi:hypothetical protein